MSSAEWLRRSDDRNSNLLFEKLKVVEQTPQQERVMIGEASDEYLRKCSAFVAQPALRQVRQGHRVAFARHERLEHGASRCAEHIRRDVAQLDVGGLKDLLYAIGRLAMDLDQLTT